MTKRKMPKQRRLAFESLETRTLLAIIINNGPPTLADPNGVDRGMVEVEWNQPVPQAPVTHEQAGGPTYDFKVRLYPTVQGAGNTYPVTVNFSDGLGDKEALFTPASVTFAAGEANDNPSAWKYFGLTGKDDFAEDDDGNKVYSINVSTASNDPLGVPDPVFTGINGAVFSFTNLDNDLKAMPDEGYSVFEMDASTGPDTAWSLNVGENDQDLGGNGSWHVFHASLNIGQGAVEVPDPGPFGPLRHVRYRPADDWYGNFTIFYANENEWGQINGTTAKGTVVNIPDKPIANPDEGVTGRRLKIMRCLQNDPIGLARW